MRTAADYYLQTSEAESYACSGLLDELPPMRISQDGRLKCHVHKAPHLLRKEAKHLFPDQAEAPMLTNPAEPMTVLTLAQKTQSDMSVWSDEMEEERDKCVADFVGAAKEICAR